MTQNLNDKYKNDTIATLFYNASGTYRESMFLESWRSILAFSNDSGKYLNDVGITWLSHVLMSKARFKAQSVRPKKISPQS